MERAVQRRAGDDARCHGAGCAGRSRRRGAVVGGTGLAGETFYWWALRAVDEAGHVGPLSVVVSARTNAVPPAAVQDLRATVLGMTGVDLAWTAPGDDGETGQAAQYELRYAPWSITAYNFALATLVAAPPAPGTAGTAQRMTVEDLSPGTLYRFALVTRDRGGAA
jgi:hypothetical protein